MTKTVKRNIEGFCRVILEFKKIKIKDTLGYVSQINENNLQSIVFCFFLLLICICMVYCLELKHNYWEQFFNIKL
jgi:hypothetical protein